MSIQKASLSPSCNGQHASSSPDHSWKQKLFTKEDPFHLHKTLALLCLASFVWRFSLFGAADLGFRSHPQWTLVTLILHFSLHLSSFAFSIPAKRIASTSTGGWRIWPEYRLHAAIFCLSQLSCIALVNPFVMTLQRKNLIAHEQALGVHAAMLGWGAILVVSELSISHGEDAPPPLTSIVAVAFVAAVWRMGPWPQALRSKYLIWPTVYWLLETVIRPGSSQQNLYLAIASFVAVVANGLQYQYATIVPTSLPPRRASD
ncbi:unknown protein [Seminavis robusta]|uniref:Uncharacterized protein n=1 Tax=Seminavis robusta TaxID=568900 RepID=A0A9N8EBY3_9STRA|nr:unknown protein [Seminavis robusta]|eukprot:Sro945_g223190.1 n/a (260) ;mRNA; f:39348-40369